MPRPPKTPDLPAKTRRDILLFLAGRVVNDKLAYGAITEVTRRFKCCANTVRKVWRTKDSDAPASRRGRPPIHAASPTVVERLARIESVLHHKRKTMRALAAATGISASTIWCYVKRKFIRRTKSTVKPLLTEGQKYRRLTYALSCVERPLGRRLYWVNHMYDRVHIDEKWFNLYRETETFYLTHAETDPYRTSPNKRYIGKVMFLAAVARPRYDASRRCQFDGKIGIWPIVESTVALRSSKNRPTGTPIIKCINMTRAVYTRFVTEKVIPAIKALWPGRKSRTIFIQQDNAGPHTLEGDPVVAAAGRQGGWKIRVVCQPPRSPDLNVLDLGLFHSIQSIQYQDSTFTVEELVDTVVRSYQRVPSETIGKCFVTLQGVVAKVIEHLGHNDYKLPRMRSRFYRSSSLPLSIPCESGVVDCGIDAAIAYALSFC